MLYHGTFLARAREERSRIKRNFISFDRKEFWIMEKSPTFIDLFCGAGGLSKGLTNSGYKLLWAIDYDKKCKPTFEANHKVEMTVGDIREYNPPQLGLKNKELDLIAGGPPCPTFSLVGRTKINSLKDRNVKEDERSFLYQEFLRYVDHYQPKAFLMENVKGMISAKNTEGKSVVNIIKTEMEDLGYAVKVQILNAANYGVPQRRERIFFIGNRLGIENPDFEAWETHRPPENDNEKQIKFLHRGSGKKFPNFNKNAEKKPWNTVAEAILDLPPVSPEGTIPPKKMSNYTMPAISEYQKWARNLGKKKWKNAILYNHECRGHNMRDLTIYKLLGEGVSWIIGDLPENAQPYRTDIFNDKYKKQNPLEPSSTIVAHLYKDGNMFIHPREARTITAREAARLQSFKDTFVFPVARTHAFKQIGNAVPPLLAQAVGTVIKTDLLEA